jgi:hypothetical protein
MDLIITFVLGVNGELAACRGLKLSNALRMRLDVEGRVRAMMDRQFRVASTRRPSLGYV